MKHQMMRYTDGDIIAFERFGDFFESEEDSEQWSVQQRFADMNMVVLVVCYRGSIQLRLGGRDYEATAGWGLACLPSATIDRLTLSPDVHLRGFGFSVTAMESMFHTYRSTWQEALSLNDHPLLQLSEGHMQVVEHLYQIIRQERQMTECRHYRPMIRSLVQSLLYMLADIINKVPKEAQQTVPQREQQFKRFVQLLWSSGGKVRNVAYFADQMCITPKYLSVVVRESCGKTPLQMIHGYTANIIAQWLRNTTLSIKEIARELNFDNESFFGRYVKQHLGYPPLEYRQRMQDESLR